MLKNKEFIFRGAKLAKRIDVFETIKKHFSDAININDYNFPSLDV